MSQEYHFNRPNQGISNLPPGVSAKCISPEEPVSLYIVEIVLRVSVHAKGDGEAIEAAEELLNLPTSATIHSSQINDSEPT